MERKKKHADFQDEYRRSSNFGKSSDDEELEIKGDGKVKLEKDDKMKSKEEKEEVEDILKDINSEEEE